MILTNDLTIAKRAKYFTTQAKDESIFSVHNEIGYNFRLSNIQAALGLAQLESLPKLLKKKNLIHQQYKKKIKKIKGLNISKTPNHAKRSRAVNRGLSIMSLVFVMPKLVDGFLVCHPPLHLEVITK